MCTQISCSWTKKSLLTVIVEHKLLQMETIGFQIKSTWILFVQLKHEISTWWNRHSDQKKRNAIVLWNKLAKQKTSRQWTKLKRRDWNVRWQCLIFVFWACFPFRVFFYIHFFVLFLFLSARIRSQKKLVESNA